MNMAFPFSIKYTAVLQPTFGPEYYEEVLDYVKDLLLVKSVDNVVVNESKLSFKAKGAGRSDLMGPIERGIFALSSNGENVLLSYEFFLSKLFLIVFVVAIAVGLTSRDFWTGFFCFFWLGVMNWIVALLRHKVMFNNIVAEINAEIISSQ